MLSVMVESRRILVVDDQEDIRHTVHALLDHCLPQAIVREAEDAESALVNAQAQQAAGTPYDTIITDYKMGHLTGLDLIKILNVKGEGPRTILMSASPEAEDLARQEPAVDFFLRKPFDPSDVEAAITKTRPARRR